MNIYPGSVPSLEKVSNYFYFKKYYFISNKKSFTVYKISFIFFHLCTNNRLRSYIKIKLKLEIEPIKAIILIETILGNK